MRTTPVALASTLVISLAVGLPRPASAQPAAPLRIQNITVQPDAGTIRIGGTGLGADLVVFVDGQPATVLAGASATQLEVAAPATILTTPGTYRVTVMDPVRQIGDAFVVASQAPRVDLVGATLSGNAGAAPGAGPTRGESAAASSGALTARPLTGAPSPMTVIEDSGSPYRTAIGHQALFSNTTGLRNTASGYRALSSNTTGNYNTASGYYALQSNTSGGFNTANGQFALSSNTTGSFNSGIGSSALDFNTTGNYNTAIGAEALLNNTTAFGNTASGYRALRSNTTGDNNTASGYHALYTNGVGGFNSATGSRALYSTTSGNYNTASGYQALFSNTTGSLNTASGDDALLLNTTGHSNTAVGSSALSANTTGISNVAVGRGAGSAATGSYNLFLGADVVGDPADTNTIRIGLPYNGGLGVGENRTFIAGIRGTQLTGSAVQVFIDANGQLGTLTPPILTGTISGPMSQLQQQLAVQQTRLEQQQTTIAELQAALAAVRVRLAALDGRRPR